MMDEDFPLPAEMLNFAEAGPLVVEFSSDEEAGAAQVVFSSDEDSEHEVANMLSIN